MLEQLRARNPQLAILSVTDPAFGEYGRVIEGLDTAALVAAANAIPRPENGSAYLASVPTFEALPIAAEIEEKIFGTLPSQLGYCHGHSSFLNATEWHDASEFNFAVTPLVLILGRRSQIKCGRIDSGDMKAFFVPAGTAIECYATTLHFCPCEVEASGFGFVVGLPRGTNTPLEKPSADPLLWARNKWLLAHEANAGLVARGAVPGIYGENYEIHY